MKQKGRKVGVLVLGSALLIAFGVAMFLVSGPASGSMGGRGLEKRVAFLDSAAETIVARANKSLETTGGAVMMPPELRFEGQVLRIPVSEAWDALSLSAKKQVVFLVVHDYVTIWQRQMESRHEPAIVFMEQKRRVALHTQLDHWILEEDSGSLPPVR